MLALYVRLVWTVTRSCKKFNINCWELYSTLQTLCMVLFFRLPFWKITVHLAKNISKAYITWCAPLIFFYMNDFAIAHHALKPLTFTNTFMVHANLRRNAYFMPILFFKNKWGGWSYLFQFDTRKCSVLLPYIHAMWTAAGAERVSVRLGALHHAWKRKWVNRYMGTS